MNVSLSAAKSIMACWISDSRQVISNFTLVLGAAWVWWYGSRFHYANQRMTGGFDEMLIRKGYLCKDEYRGERDAHWFYEAQHIVVATRAVLVDFMGRFLLVRRRSDRRWALPYGVMLPGESAEDCMERVVRAQTGLEVAQRAPFIADSGKYMRMPGRPEVQLVVFGFRVTKWRGYADASNSEIMDSGWFMQDEAYDLFGQFSDDVTAIEDHICTDYDPPVPAEGGIVWVR